MSPTSPHEERLAQVEADLAELDGQVEQGELDVETADLLRSRYLEERERLLGEDEAESVSALDGRRLLGIGFLLVAVIGMALWLIASNTEDRSAVEGVAGEVVDGGGVNLDDISNEQMEAVVAENPGIPGMRLALADRYFAAGEFSDALTHYMYVLQTLEVKDPTALANVGWMTYLSNEPDVAESFVEESLEVQPDGGIAFWYLANIRFFGLGDAAGAAEPLQQLLAYDNLPEQLRTEAEALLAEVEAAQ
jgi:tetratricopeptide (TPR) repeat protein